MVDVVTTEYLPAPAGEADGYIQRFTFPQSGQVKGCFVVSAPVSTFNSTITFGTGIQFGFSDGTQDYAFGGSIQDASQDSFCRLVNDLVLVSLDYVVDQSVNLEAAVDSLGLIAGTNDGYVDLRWVKAPASGDNRIIAVQVFAGSGVSCKALDVETGAVTGNLVEAAFGFKPTFGLSLTNHNPAMLGVGVLPSNSGSATMANIHFSLGIWDSGADAVPGQKGVTWEHKNNTSNAVCLVEDYIARYVTSTGSASVFTGGAAQVVNLDANGCDLQTVNSAAQNIAMLGVQLENASATVAHQSTPTATGAGNWGQSARTQALIVIPTRVATLGTAETDSDAGPFGVSLIDRNNQLSFAFGFQDASNNVFARISDNKLAVLPLHDGSLGPAHFDVDFSSLGGSPSFNTSFNAAATDTSTARIWPTLHIQNDNPTDFDTVPALSNAVAVSHNVGDSSIEYFEGGSAETLLQGVTSGGSLTLDPAEGLGTIDCSGGITEAAFWYDKIPLSKTKTWAVRATIRFESGTNHPDVFSIVNSASAPSFGSVFVLAAEKRIQCGLVDDLGPFARVGYFQSGANAASPIYGDGVFWNGVSKSWGPSGAEQNAVSVRKGPTEDFYTFTIFNRGDTQEFSILIQNSADATNLRDDRQGEIAMQTDWVPWSSFSAATDSLWLLIGDRYINTGSSKYAVHMYEKDTGGANPKRAILNCRDDLDDDYDAREVIGADKVWILAARDALIFSDAETYGSGGIRKRSWITDNDGTIYLFYEAFQFGGALGPRGAGGTGETRIKLKTSTDGGVTWSAPTTLIAPTDVAAGYQVVTGIQVIKWNQHPVTAERCMMFLTAEVSVSASSEHRMFVFTAQNLGDATWTKKSGSGTDGAIFEGTATNTDYNHSGHGDPVVSGVGGAWHIMISSLHSPDVPSGVNPIQGWQISHATSVDAGTPVNWTLGTAPPHIPNDVLGIRTATAVSGSNVTVAPTELFVNHAVVLFRRNNSDSDEWGMYKIRKVGVNDLDLVQEVVGMSPMTSNSSIAVIGTGSITPHYTRIMANGDIELIGTMFQPFIRGDGNGDGFPEGVGNCEFTGRWTSPDYENWTVDFDHSPAAIVTTAIGRNIENFSVLQEPIGPPTEIPVDPIPTIDRGGTQLVTATIELLPVEEETDTNLLGWDTGGVRYTVTESVVSSVGFTTSLVVDARIEVGLVTVGGSGSTVSLVGALTLVPSSLVLVDLPLTMVGSSGSTVTLAGGLLAIGLVPSLEPDDIPVIEISGSGSTVNEGVVWFLELGDDDINVAITMGGSHVVASLELTPTCGKVEDVCQPLCVLDIWNGALMQLGLPRQTDVTATNKYLAAIRLSWTRVRKEMIRESILNGATDRRALVEISDGAQHRSDYSKAFELPSCWIKSISINGKNAAQEGGDLYTIAISYDQTRRVLYTNEGTCELHFVMDVYDVNLLDASSQTALVNMLALDIAPAFKDPEEVEALRARYERHVLEARVTDTQENSPEEFEDYTDALFWNS